MNLRDRGPELRGKLVGREGLEPSTKRLRVSLLNAAFRPKKRRIPLRRSRETVQKSTASPCDLRDCAVVGRHGFSQIIEVRDERGRKSLRYIRP